MRVDTSKVTLFFFLPLLMAQSELVTLPQVQQLELAFSQADDLEIVRTLDEMPSDIRDILSTYVSPWPTAELGEYVNLGDLQGSDNVPDKQHIYTAVSASLSAVVFRAGSTAAPPLTMLLLQDRQSKCGAIYQLGRTSYIPWLEQVQSSIGGIGTYKFPVLFRQFCPSSEE